MLSGDHVLPRITPNIPYHPQAGANPLGDYLASLDKLEPYRVGRCCRRTSTASTICTARLEELRQHHRERFGEVIAILREGPHTAWDMAPHMKWSRPWDDIAGFMRRAAVGEAVSHLRVLEIDGRGGGRGRRAGAVVAGGARHALTRTASGHRGPAPPVRLRSHPQRPLAERTHLARRLGPEDALSRAGLSPAAAQTTD